MGEQKAPYLHVVRPDSASEGAQQADTAEVDNPPSDVVSALSASSGGASETSSETSSAASTAETIDATPPPSQPLSQAIMYAVVAWLALCVERVAVAVDIQPIAERLYEVSAHYDEERSEGIILRVRLEVEPGLVVRTTVEPVRP